MSPAATTAVAAVDPAQLPDDPALLKAMLAESLAALRASRQEGERLQARLDQLLRRLYGPRSERLPPDQPLLFPEATADQPATPPPVAPAETAKPRRKGHGRQQLPKHLPRDRRVYELSGAERLCLCCGQARVVIGQEVSEQLDYEPASLKVIEHVRLTYACPACEKQRQAGTPATPTAAATANTAAGSFSAAELNDPATMSLIPEKPTASTFRTALRPPSPIPRGLAGPGLLAHLIVSKFCDHLPLYRSERMLARFGVNLARSTLCDWLAQSAALLRRLWELLKARVLQSLVIQTDDTPVRVQAQAGVAAHQGRLWVQVGDAGHRYLVYFYSPNREGQWPQTFLAGYAGFVQGDAYALRDSLWDVLSAPASAVISGLPLVTKPMLTRLKLIRRATPMPATTRYSPRGRLWRWAAGRTPGASSSRRRRRTRRARCTRWGLSGSCTGWRKRQLNRRGNRNCRGRSSRRCGYGCGRRSRYRC